MTIKYQGKHGLDEELEKHGYWIQVESGVPVGYDFNDNRSEQIDQAIQKSLMSMMVIRKHWMRKSLK